MTAESGSIHVARSESPSRDVRPLYWSVRRELWENRFLWMVPASVAALVLVSGLLTIVITLARSTHEALTTTPKGIATHLSISPAPIMLCSLLVGVFYALDAMYGERRDRSILFWKSLPVSDMTSVAAKLMIPVIVAPAIGLALSVATQFTILVAAMILTRATDIPLPVIWNDAAFIEGLPIMAYGLFAHALWYAPLYAWALLISAWARRAPALWFFVPPVLLVAVESMLTQTSAVSTFIMYRLRGVMGIAFDDSPDSSRGHIDRFDQLEPLALVTSPGFWLGLLFAGAAALASTHLRRRREPH